MKRILLVLMSVFMLALLVGCGSDTNKAADSLLENQDLVVPDSVTEGSAVENISAEADEAYNKNWTEFKAACN